MENEALRCENETLKKKLGQQNEDSQTLQRIFNFIDCQRQELNVLTESPLDVILILFIFLVSLLSKF